MLLYEELTFKVRRAIFNVYNALGYGHKESVYEKALIKEFQVLKIPFVTEKSIDVKYRDEKVGSYKPDFIIDNKIIIEIKAVEIVTKSAEIQLFRYLKSTYFKVGFLVNFGSNKIYIKRFIWTKNP
jgi:GxxExxY protein